MKSTITKVGEPPSQHDFDVFLAAMFRSRVTTNSTCKAKSKFAVTGGNFIKTVTQKKTKEKRVPLESLVRISQALREPTISQSGSTSLDVSHVSSRLVLW